MSVKFCGKCGSGLKEGAKFCAKCGWRVPIIPEEPTKIISEPEKISSKNIPPEFIPPEKSSSNKTGEPSPRQFNDNGNHTNNNSSFQERENKKAGRNIGIIVTIVLSSIVIIIMSFLLIKTLKERADNGALELTNNVSQDGKVDANQKDQGSEGINGVWALEVITEKVNGKDSESYKDILGKSIYSDLNINEQEKIATIVEKNSGLEMPMPLEVNGKKIVFGFTLEENTTEYTGKLFKNKDGQIIEGNWKSKAKNGDQDVQMEGTFRAEKFNPLIPKAMLAKAVSMTSEELQGIYKGTLTYKEFKNMDKAPEKEMPPEEVKMLLDLKDKPLACRIVVDDGDIEVFATIPNLGEGTILEDLEVESFKDGVLIDVLTDEGDEEYGIKSGTIAREMVTLDKGGSKGIFGIAKMNIFLASGDIMSMQFEFDTLYDGPVEE